MRTSKATRRRSRSGSFSAPTIKDIAASAGVSVATVSNVINNRTSSVSAATREIVQREIQRLNYRPQSGARSLRTMRSSSLAIIIVDESELYLQDPFAAGVVAGFTAKLNEAGYVAVVHGCRRQAFGRTAAVQRLGVDGYCLFLSGSEASRLEIVTQMAAWKQPLVLIQEAAQMAPRGVCVVRQADYEGGIEVGKHLLERGVTRVGLVEPSLEWAAVSARFKGVREALGKSRVKVETIVTRNESFDEVRDTVSRRVKNQPRLDAIIAPNDQIAIAAMEALRDAGINIPGRTMVVGFNGLEFWRYCTPRLTTVRSSPFQIGEYAAVALVERIEKGHFSSHEIVLPVHFQPGETTGSAKRK